MVGDLQDMMSSRDVGKSIAGANPGYSAQDRSTREEEDMSEWNNLAQCLYGDVRTGKGFWYSHPLYEIRELQDKELFWVPDDNSLCML